MKKHKLRNIVLFNLALAIISIVFISPGFLGFYPGAPQASHHIGFFIYIAAATAVFIAVNYYLLAEKKQKVVLADKKELKGPKDYIKGLQDLSYKKEFEKQITLMIGQIKRISPKQASLDVILEQNFDKSELTYSKFKAVIDDSIGLFYDNIKKGMNRISVFDEQEYRNLVSNQLRLPKGSEQQKRQIFTEHFTYVNTVISRNENIITLLDNLILEISKLDDISTQSIENIQIISELKELISNTKYYYND